MHQVCLRAAVLWTLWSASALGSENWLWHDPGRIESYDFANGPGGRHGAPRPPFTFSKEDLSGSSPKVFVTDAAGRTWNVKFGPEVHSESFSSRVPWALGYFGQSTYFVSSGRIQKVGDLSKRAAGSFSKDGEFKNARFQFRDPKWKFMKDSDWSWTYNPFVGTRELNGLKILVMLLSNWDNKDQRDVDEGRNTAIFERPGTPRYYYAFTDWGQTLGHWGNFFRRSEWNCAHFKEDTSSFIQGTKDGKVKFGWAGRHTEEFKGDIRVEDVRWLLQYLGRITDNQLKAGLQASGATPDEVQCFCRELRQRIDMLRAAAR